MIGIFIRREPVIQFHICKSASPPAETSDGPVKGSRHSADTYLTYKDDESDFYRGKPREEEGETEEMWKRQAPCVTETKCLNVVAFWIPANADMFVTIRCYDILMVFGEFHRRDYRRVPKHQPPKLILV